MLKIGLILSALMTIPGELIRIPIGPGNGLLLNDVFLPILIVFWTIQKISADRKFKKTAIGLPLLIFISIAIISLVCSLTFLSANETISGAFYLIRFIEYAFLYIITSDIIKDKSGTKTIVFTLILTAVLISIAGFVQLKFYPDFTEMEDIGWDPHVGRLLSTWFDPNFVGGMLAFITCLAFGIVVCSKKLNIWITAAVAIMVMALFYTYSRSSYIALAGGIFIIGLFKSRKILLIIIICAVILIPFSNRAQTRILDMYLSAKSLLTETAETPDITAQHRLASWSRAIDVYLKHPILGTGYNTFKYVQSEEGLITDIKSHAASGSDSSLLTILATTGPFGFLVFLSIYILLLKTSFRNWRREKDIFVKGLNLGIFGGTISLLIHSVFVNSLLFPHIMVFFFLSAGLVHTSLSKRR